MRNTLACLLAIGLIAGAAACAPAAPPDNRAQDEAALLEADAAWAAAAASGNIDAAVAFHTADSMVFPPEQPMVSGTDAVRDLWTTMSALPGFAISWQASGAVAAMSGDIGYTWGAAQVTMNGPDGTPMTSESKYVTIWRKDEAGAWKVAADIFNGNTPAAAPPAAPEPAAGSGS